MSTVNLNLRAMNHIYKHCDALHWIVERRDDNFLRSSKWKFCCKEDGVVLFVLRDSFDLLRTLLIEQIARDRNFCFNIRSFNFALIFTFVNYKTNTRIDNAVNHELVFFQIHDKLYHMREFLHVVSSNASIFAQLYFYDSTNVIARHCNRWQDLNASLLRQLTNMLHECNSFIELYKIVDEMLRFNQLFEKNLRVILNSQILLIMKTNSNKRRYNFFTINEMTVIISNKWKIVCERDIMFTERFNNFKNLRMRWINQNHAIYMSLHYVLLFVHDELNFIED